MYGMYGMYLGIEEGLHTDHAYTPADAVMRRRFLTWRRIISPAKNPEPLSPSPSPSPFDPLPPPRAGSPLSLSLSLSYSLTHSLTHSHFCRPAARAAPVHHYSMYVGMHENGQGSQILQVAFIPFRHHHTTSLRQGVRM